MTTTAHFTPESGNVNAFRQRRVGHILSSSEFRPDKALNTLHRVLTKLQR